MVIKAGWSTFEHCAGSSTRLSDAGASRNERIGHAVGRSHSFKEYLEAQKEVNDWYGRQKW
jgi:hypothetical protein